MLLLYGKWSSTWIALINYVCSRHRYKKITIYVKYVLVFWVCLCTLRYYFEYLYSCSVIIGYTKFLLREGIYCRGNKDRRDKCAQNSPFAFALTNLKDKCVACHPLFKRLLRQCANIMKRLIVHQNYYTVNTADIMIIYYQSKTFFHRKKSHNNILLRN